jgi:hypothetical protein
MKCKMGRETVGDSYVKVDPQVCKGLMEEEMFESTKLLRQVYIKYKATAMVAIQISSFSSRYDCNN